MSESSHTNTAGDKRRGVNELPQPGRYRHYKGNDYELIDVATHSETLEQLVVYRPLYGEGKLWVRPLAMFIEFVNRDGSEVPRFKKID